MKHILVFGTYNKSYPRNRTIFSILENQGCQLIHLNRRGSGITKYLRLFRDATRLTQKFDIVFVPFPGHMAALLASFIFKKPIYFDAFISLYDTYIEDRKTVMPHSIRAWYYRFLDRIACTRVTRILVDTPQHAFYFASRFRIPESKICAIPVSTDLALFRPSESPHDRTHLVVFWHGKYSSLHNVRFIIDAAGKIQNVSVEFRLLGSGGEYHHIKELVDQRKLSQVTFLPCVTYEELPSYIQDADLCLGVFGPSDKVDRVIPNKVFEYCACGKAVITRQSRACQEMLSGADITYVSGNDPAELARAIVQFKNHRGIGYRSEVNYTISRKVASRTIESVSRCFFE